MGDRSPDEVLRLVERCLDALDERRKSRGAAGEIPASALIEELLAPHPELAPAVRARLEWLARTGMLDDGGGDAGAGAREFPERLGDFRLLEPLGRGGMGVVYRAHQESLGRDVALKLIRASEMFFPGARARFQREVEAVARLNHPGIVSIHVVGEDHGVPYFAMEYVAGLSVDHLLRRLGQLRPERLSGKDMQAALAGGAGSGSSTSSVFALGWVDACFRLMMEAGEALAHAHERGVLHRDIKPSNVMVTPGGHARVLDFGLAWSEGARPLTRSGSQPGSLPYMAPEQVRGDGAAIDARTDVYGLGVTLYEMLTLRSPYAADTVERTRDRVLAGRPVPIDRLNTAVPWDAETVCLTAMDPDPGRRYASMEALVDDMRRFLARQPIRARRPGLLLRARRWAQRSPGKAAAAALAGVLVLGGPIAYGVLERAARSDLRAAYEKEGLERKRAEQSLLDAIAAIDEMLRQGSDEEFAARPGADPARRKLLLRALELYEGLLAREGGHPALTSRVISAQTRVARLQRELGNLDEAELAARRALELCSAGAPRGAPGPAEDLGPQLDGLRSEARFALLAVLFSAGEFEEFRTVCDSMLAEPPAADEETACGQACNQAMALQLLARILQREGELDQALAAVGRAVTSCEELLQRRPGDGVLMSELAMALQTQAYFGGFYGRDPDYATSFERAVGLLERAQEVDPASPAHRNQLSKVLSDWAHADIRAGRAALAVPRAERADAILARICAEFPQRESYATGYLANAQRLSWAYRLSGDEPRAEEVLQAAIDAGRGARERLPDSDPIVFYLAMLQSELAHRLGSRGEYERADALWAGARASWEQLLSRPKPQLGHMAQVGTFYDNLARYQVARGDVEAAESSARSAVEWHERMLVRTGEREHADRLGKSLPLLAHIQADRDRPDAAVETLRRGIAGGFIDRETLASAGFEEKLGSRADYRELLERAAD
ncbi:MAG: serine/threonine-protein kinase [Planctomycetota bacterium]|nr:MAG: serine/threonine-protein kinase [Planctomycetota bacterium]